jgi:hypothetical protein
MQCEEYHKEIKDGLNLLDLNATYYKEPYNEELMLRYLIVLIFSVIIGLFLGKVFTEREGRYLKYVVSDKKELSYLGLAVVLLKLEKEFVPIVLECFKRSLLRDGQNDYKTITLLTNTGSILYTIRKTIKGEI